MKTVILTLFFLTFSDFIFGQNQKEVDSLLHIYTTNDSIRIKMYALDDLIDLYVYTKPQIAKKYIDEMMEISQEAKFKHGILRAEFCLGHYYSTLGQMELGAKYYRKTLERSKKDNDDSFVATALKNLSIYESHIGNYQEAIKLMDSSANLQLSYGNYMRYGSALNFIGESYFDMGNFPKAMAFYQTALKTMDTISIKTYHKADLLRNIGYLEIELKNYEEAIQRFNEAKKVYIDTEDNLYQAKTMIDIADVYQKEKKYSAAVSNYEKAVEIGEKFNFPTVVVEAFKGLGITHRKLGHYTKAIEFFDRYVRYDSVDISESENIAYHYNLGYTYALNDQNTEAMRNLNMAVTLADSKIYPKELRDALYYRGITYEKKGDLIHALSDLKLSQKIKDSIFSMEQAREVRKLQAIYETEKKEAKIALQKEEIKTLSEKAKVDKLTKRLYAGGMFSFVAVSGLLFFGFRQRIKKNRLAREKKEEIYKQEIEHKKKELASQTLHLVQKNTFIQELMLNLENIRKSPELFKTEFRRIVMLLKRENASDKDWEVFKTYFADVHNDFDQKLKTIFSDISEKEIRLAAFLRMNLTTKEIAATLNVLPDSILKSKYRLKKKLGLDKETDLTGFLNTL